MLDGLDVDRVERYQPYWAVRAWLLASAGQDASGAYDRAIGLTADDAVRTWLLDQRTTT